MEKTKCKSCFKKSVLLPTKQLAPTIMTVGGKEVDARVEVGGYLGSEIRTWVPCVIHT